MRIIIIQDDEEEQTLDASATTTTLRLAEDFTTTTRWVGDTLVERKTFHDLAGRMSRAHGAAHEEQCRTMRSSGIPYVFVLIEGSVTSFSAGRSHDLHRRGHVVYDAHDREEERSTAATSLDLFGTLAAMLYRHDDVRVILSPGLREMARFVQYLAIILGGHDRRIIVFDGRGRDDKVTLVGSMRDDRRDRPISS